MHKRLVNWMDNPNADRVKRVAQLAGRSAVRNLQQCYLVEGPSSPAEAIRAHLGLLHLSEAAADFWHESDAVAEVYYTDKLSASNPEFAEIIDQLTGNVFIEQSSD